ncbi:MAG: cytochrome c peroxidase [Gammaproteobacteria bacterium]
MIKYAIASFILMSAIQTAWADGNSASTAEIRAAWLEFNHARGDASLIKGDIDHASANEVFRVIPEVGSDSLEAARLQLGFDLFNERRLSRDGSVACSTCHVGLLGGVDRQPVSFGVGRARGTLNAPTIFNAALNFRQFWDGRSLTLQDQALEPIQNPVEFDHDLPSAVAVLQAIPNYANSFAELYPDGITAANLADAIAYYEIMNFTGVSTPYLRQFDEETSSLSRRAQRGQKRFVEVGCASCHNGVNLGGNSFQKLGTAKAWFDADRPASDADLGLVGRTGREQDRHVFKVPTLHSVANTGPWYHDGSVTSLQQAVDQMARHQSGRYLDNHDIDDIVSFLRALGDSQGMIGDCAAGGRYGVTMDCSVKQRTVSNDQPPQSARPDLPDAEILSDLHSKDYKLTLEITSSAPSRIENEMQRIRSGEVAHYDFLQYEHIEMLRHARALSFPPAEVDSEMRASMLQQAEQWQAAAAQYELTIADFLRSHAVSLNAKLNYQDLLRAFSLGADEKTQALLVRAEDSVIAYFQQPDSETRTRLEDTTRALATLDLNSERYAELQHQVQMLVSNAPELVNSQP